MNLQREKLISAKGLQLQTQDFPNDDQIYEYIFANQLQLENRAEIFASLEEDEEKGHKWITWLKKKVVSLATELLDPEIITVEKKKEKILHFLLNSDALDAGSNTHRLVETKYQEDPEWDLIFQEFVNYEIEWFLENYENFDSSEQETFITFSLKYRNFLNPTLQKKIEEKINDPARIEATRKRLGETIPEAFKKGNLLDLRLAFQAHASIQDQPLRVGPENKNPETVKLEQLIQHILLNPDEDIFHAQEQKVFCHFQGEKIDLADWLSRANFNHLSIDETTLTAYENYLRGTPLSIRPQAVKANKDPEYNIKDILEIFNEKQDPSLADLKHGEKLSLNIYTADLKGDLNQFMRGQYQCLFDRRKNLKTASVKEYLLATCIGVQALNKVKPVEVQSAFRIDKALPDSLVQERMKAASQGRITRETGFLSTAYGKPEQNFHNKAFNSDEPPPKGTQPVGTLFTGSLIAVDVSSISAFPNEREFLMPPIQVQWKSCYQNTNGKGYYFIAKPVRTPACEFKFTETDQKILEKKLSGISGFRFSNAPKLKELNKSRESILATLKAYNDETTTAEVENLVGQIQKYIKKAQDKIISNHLKLIRSPRQRRNDKILMDHIQVLYAIEQDLVFCRNLEAQDTAQNPNTKESGNIITRFWDFLSNTSEPHIRDFIIGALAGLVVSIVIAISIASMGTVPAILGVGATIGMGASLFWMGFTVGSICLSLLSGGLAALLGRCIAPEEEISSTGKILLGIANGESPQPEERVELLSSDESITPVESPDIKTQPTPKPQLVVNAPDEPKSGDVFDDGEFKFYF